MTQTSERRVAPQALPSALPTDKPRDLLSVLRPLLPLRSAEDVLAGEIHLTLGDRQVELGVLPIRANRAWKAKVSEQFGVGLSLAGRETDAAGIIAALSGLTDVQLDLLFAYDQDGRLPDRDWIEDHATEAQLLTALLAVLAAAFPFVATGLTVLLESGDLQAGIRRVLAMPEVREAMTRAFSESTNGAQPNTAGAQGDSKTS